MESIWEEGDWLLVNVSATRSGFMIWGTQCKMKMHAPCSKMMKYLKTASVGKALNQAWGSSENLGHYTGHTLI